MYMCVYTKPNLKKQKNKQTRLKPYFMTNKVKQAIKF